MVVLRATDNAALDAAKVRDVILRWEKRRLVYNAALAIAVLLAVRLRGDLDEGRLWLFIGSRAVLVNALFFAGHAGELLAAWLGLRSRAIGCALFACGTMFSLAMAFLAVSNFGWA